MAAIEAALMQDMPNQFSSLEEFMAEETKDAQTDNTMISNDQNLNMDDIVVNKQEEAPAVQQAPAEQQAMPEQNKNLTGMNLLCKDTQD